MFKSILIANRGEIACRVIRTANQMGIETIAIYSTADTNSLHVREASRAYWVGESPAKDSYLNIDAIIHVAIQSGAEAIHPGYGFLSENAEFARACEQAGIVFIGPSVAAMEAMASKQLAKQRLQHSNVPLTPGYHGANQEDATLLLEAKKIGFPVLLKAANGGGGKGMRAVHNEADFAEALAGARREAKAYFADDVMIIEKLVVNPRHVEVQIMADNHGQVVHLFERDCSIQRRHQKIIEEAPAPELSSGLRWGLAEAAAEVARSIDYRGAGTVEFLVAEDEQFYFMEMNTRLQVEHPVTEMITGLDLVAWQIKIAANQNLPLQQGSIKMHGHAIECRIYAEDPHQGFIPSIGQIHFLKIPTGEGIRVDSGVCMGSSISQYYDPMIAKLITWGETRTQALQRMRQALAHFAIGGVTSNIPFLQAVCNNKRFSAAKLSTDFLAEESIQLPEPNKALALLMAVSHDYLSLSKNADPLLLQSFGWQMHLQGGWRWRYKLGQQDMEVQLTPITANQFCIQQGECKQQIIATATPQGLTVDDGLQKQHAFVNEHNQLISIYLEQGTVIVERYRQEHRTEQASSFGKLTAPMPSTVVSVLKKPGEAVKQGETVMILEAMKMEHSIRAPRDAHIIEVFYKSGTQVNEGAELFTLTDDLAQESA